MRYSAVLFDFGGVFTQSRFEAGLAAITELDALLATS